jgi:hypothetical protein
MSYNQTQPGVKNEPDDVTDGDRSMKSDDGESEREANSENEDGQEQEQESMVCMEN